MKREEILTYDLQPQTRKSKTLPRKVSLQTYSLRSLSR